MKKLREEIAFSALCLSLSSVCFTESACEYYRSIESHPSYNIYEGTSVHPSLHTEPRILIPRNLKLIANLNKDQYS
jgi:hypothetical protein